MENGDADWEGNLVAAHHKLQLMEKMISGDSSEKETWKRYDWEFHLAVIQACNSRTCWNYTLLFTTSISDIRCWFSPFGRRSRTGTSHKIFQAALDRNASGAADLLEEHILNGWSIL